MALKIKGNTVLDFGGGSYHTNANVAVVGDSGSIAVGFQALWNVTTGANNTAVGYKAGAGILEGSNNVILGAYTGTDAPISENESGWIVIADGQGVIRQVVDPSGNVGFGTLNPLYGVDVAGTINVATPTVIIAGSNVLESFESTNTYIQNTYLPLAGGTLTGRVNVTSIGANNTIGNPYQILASNGNGAYWADSAQYYYKINSNTDLRIQTNYIIDTSNGTVEVTLPNTVELMTGTTIELADGEGDKVVNPVLVRANGGTIIGLNDDLMLDYNHFYTKLIYNGNTWLVFAS